LTGEFGRVSYNKYNPTSGKNALKDLEAHLPFKCWGIYYRDEIGNISTSHAARGVIIININFRLLKVLNRCY
jgi:oligosaccharyltransferase complex subunit alpha (ribophorin I)